MKENNFSGGLKRRYESKFLAPGAKKRKMDDAGICWGIFILHDFTSIKRIKIWIFYKLYTQWKMVLCWNEETNQDQSKPINPH